ILLMVSASAATSPFAFTVSFCVNSPLATAVTTFTIPRTCSVRLAAITLTLSVKSFHVPATPLQVSAHGVHRVGQVLPRSGHARHVRLSAEPAFGTDFAGHARHFGSE